MHPELRLIEDFLTDRGVLALPALPRMLYVVRGAINVGQRVLGQGEALFGEDIVTAHAEGTGATLWRCELSDPRQPAVPAQRLQSALDARSSRSRSRHLPEGDLLWRGDSVAFPPGGCAYLHRHQGPGIRCLIEGDAAHRHQRAVAHLRDRRRLVRERARTRCSRRPATARRASSAC